MCSAPNIFLKHSGTLKHNTIKRYYIAIHCNPSLYINKAGLLPNAVLLVLFRRAHLAQNWRVVVFTASFTVAKY